MLRRLLLVLCALAALGLFTAGCGDDDDNGSDDATTAAETTAEETTAETTTETDDTDVATGDEDVDAAVEAAVDACKQSVGAAPQLKPDTVSDLEGLCEEAASGDIEDVEAAAREVCVKIAEDAIPAGAARDQAVETCETATATP